MRQTTEKGNHAVLGEYEIKGKWVFDLYQNKLDYVSSTLLWMQAWQRISNDKEIDYLDCCWVKSWFSYRTLSELGITSPTRNAHTRSYGSSIQWCKYFSRRRWLNPESTGNMKLVLKLFVREKKDGTFGMKLNQFTTKHHFKMDSLITIGHLVEKDCFVACIDLKDAYYSVSVAKQHRAYLRFVLREKLYQFTWFILLIAQFYETSEACS